MDKNAMDYGMVRHHFPEVIDVLRQVLARGYTPDQVEQKLEEDSTVPHSWRKHLAGAARYMAQAGDVDRLDEMQEVQKILAKVVSRMTEAVGGDE